MDCQTAFRLSLEDKLLKNNHRRKVKGCHWPLRTAEADGEAVSERVGRGGVRRAFGMWQRRTEEDGAKTDRRRLGGGFKG